MNRYAVSIDEAIRNAALFVGIPNEVVGRLCGTLATVMVSDTGFNEWLAAHDVEIRRAALEEAATVCDKRREKAMETNGCFDSAIQGTASQLGSAIRSLMEPK